MFLFKTKAQKDALLKAEEEALSNINELPDPQAFQQYKPRHRHKSKNHDDMQSTHVNINSLLDVLSVILVFLMKSYSANTIQIKPSADLQAPFSHAAADVAESTAITITLKSILVDDVPVLMFENGKPPKDAVSSGGYLINPLFERLQDAVKKQKEISQSNQNATFKGNVALIADRHVPFTLITQVANTAAQAEFSKFKFAAIKVER